MLQCKHSLCFIYFFALIIFAFRLLWGSAEFRIIIDVCSVCSVIMTERITSFCFVTPQAACTCLWLRRYRWGEGRCRRRRSGPSWTRAQRVFMNSSAEVNRRDNSHFSQGYPATLAQNMRPWDGRGNQRPWIAVWYLWSAEEHLLIKHFQSIWWSAPNTQRFCKWNWLSGFLWLQCKP